MKSDRVTKPYQSENELNKLNFYIQSAYLYPFSVMVDSSFVVDGLISFIKDRQQRNRESDQNNNKLRHASI